MKTMLSRTLLAIVAALMSSAACADFVLRIGDTVHANGRTYTRAEWDKIKNDPSARAAAAAQPQPASSPQSPPPAARETVQAASVASTTKSATNLQSAELRAATCRTTRGYDEFPAESETFSCTGNLGNLTREEILRAGWKVDLIEKLPAPAGEAATSSRGLPLNYYKLVLSR